MNPGSGPTPNVIGAGMRPGPPARAIRQLDGVPSVAVLAGQKMQVHPKYIRALTCIYTASSILVRAGASHADGPHAGRTPTERGNPGLAAIVPTRRSCGPDAPIPLMPALWFPDCRRRVRPLLSRAIDSEFRRVLYVGTSRAQKLLILAVHSDYHDRVAALLKRDSVPYDLVQERRPAYCRRPASTAAGVADDAARLRLDAESLPSTVLVTPGSGTPAAVTQFAPTPH